MQLEKDMTGNITAVSAGKYQTNDANEGAIT